jgi:hypothetical protein
MKYFSAKPGALSAPLELARFGRLPFSITTVSGLHIYQRDLEAWRVAARSHPATVAHCRDCAEF